MQPRRVADPLPLCLLVSRLQHLLVSWLILTTDIAALTEFYVHDVDPPQTVGLVNQVYEVVWDEVVSAVLVIFGLGLEVLRIEEECK